MSLFPQFILGTAGCIEYNFGPAAPEEAGEESNTPDEENDNPGTELSISPSFDDAFYNCLSFTSHNCVYNKTLEATDPHCIAEVEANTEAIETGVLQTVEENLTFGDILAGKSKATIALNLTQNITWNTGRGPDDLVAVTITFGDQRDTFMELRDEGETLGAGYDGTFPLPHILCRGAAFGGHVNDEGIPIDYQLIQSFYEPYTTWQETVGEHIITAEYDRPDHVWIDQTDYYENYSVDTIDGSIDENYEYYSGDSIYWGGVATDALFDSVRMFYGVSPDESLDYAQKLIYYKDGKWFEF